MNRQKHFEQSLERGLDFEQGQAINVLHKIFPKHFIVNNKVDPSVSTGGKVIGPRMYRGVDREDELILPDFTLFAPDGHISWVDAKLKGNAYPHPQNRRRYFSLDGKKHKEYMEFPEWMRNNFYLLFKHEKTKEIYLADFQDNPETLTFNNQYSVGPTPIYYLDMLQQLFGVHDK